MKNTKFYTIVFLLITVLVSSSLYAEETVTGKVEYVQVVNPHSTSDSYYVYFKLKNSDVDFYINNVNDNEYRFFYTLLLTAANLQKEVVVTYDETSTETTSKIPSITFYETIHIFQIF